MTLSGSVIVLAWNGIGHLGSCLSSVFVQRHPDFEVLVVDNGSTDGSADYVAHTFPGARCIRNNENLGYAGGNNVGLRAARGDFMVLLNQDTVVEPDWLCAVERGLREPGAGLVGCKIYYPDGRLQHAGGWSGPRGHVEHFGRGQSERPHFDRSSDVEIVTGAAIGLTRSTLDRIGPLDEGFGRVYYEDCDWCYRARFAGLRVLYWPDARLTHWESSSARTIDDWDLEALLHAGRLRLLVKHKPLTWLEQRFSPAELAWLNTLEDELQRRIISRAYRDLELALTELLAYRMLTVDSGAIPYEIAGRMRDLITLLRRSAC